MTEKSKRRHSHLVVELFNAGDYVSTTDGVGIVVADEKEYVRASELVFGKVHLKLKFHTSTQSPDRVIAKDRNFVTAITEEAYNDSEDFG